MTEIVVVVPVLGRPHRAQPLVDSFLAAQTAPSLLLFVASAADLAQVDACRAAASVADTGTIVIPDTAGHGDFARKVNRAFAATSEPFLFQAADDVEFTDGWDVEALRVADETGAGVVGTNDDANPMVKRGEHSTHSLIRRSYVDECGGSLDGPGVVFHEGYGHQWVDNELVELAKSRDCFAFAADSVVRHSHPIWRTALDDATYRKGQATALADRRLFAKRRKGWV